jgi:hypothetical protein
LTDTHLIPGLPHVSMYADGHPFASVYFGTKEEAAEEARAKWIANSNVSLVIINPVTGLPQMSLPQNSPIRFDPNTGLPVNGKSPFVNPVTGLPDDADTPSTSSATGVPQNSTNSSATGLPNLTVALQNAVDLMNRGRYEDSLGVLTNYFEQSRSDPSQGGVRVSFALSDWVELGRRYPEAKQALLDIRDHDTQKLLNGEGYFDLFNEVNGINQNLGDDEATYTLFKSIEQRDPKLAGQCYFVFESQLVEKGDYEICRKYMGNPQVRFQLDSNEYQTASQLEARMAAGNRQTAQRMAELNRQRGLTNIPTFQPPDSSAFLKNNNEDIFVHNIRDLVEILVATGDKSDAVDVQRKALAVLDDPRLRRVVSDAEANVRKTR